MRRAVRVSRGAALLHNAQYYGERPYAALGGLATAGGSTAGRADEARIAEAARREAYRIQQERAYRRAARQARRDHSGHYRGH